MIYSGTSAVQEIASALNEVMRMSEEVQKYDYGAPQGVYADCERAARRFAKAILDTIEYAQEQDDPADRRRFVLSDENWNKFMQMLDDGDKE